MGQKNNQIMFVTLCTLSILLISSVSTPLAFALHTNAPASATSGNGIIPDYYVKGQGNSEIDFKGNPTCQELGFDNELRMEDAEWGGPTLVDGVYTDGTLIFTVYGSTSKTFGWSSNFEIDAVVTKAGTESYAYIYDPEDDGDTLIDSPQNKDISHILACYDDEDIPAQGTITVQKVCLDGPTLPDFAFNADFTADFTLTCDGDDTFDVDAGTYSVSEDISDGVLPAGWIYVSGECVLGANPIASDDDNDGVIDGIDVAGGDAVVCTFTNLKLPTIKITKLLTDGSADAEFCFDVTRDGDDSADYQACIDTAVASMDGPTSVPEGDWSIDEDLTGLPLYELESVTCTLNGEDTDPDFPITLVASDELECTYTNIQKASIAVEKICIDTIDVDDTYSFSIDGGDAFDVQCGDTSDPTVVDLGTRTVVEDDTTIPPGWALDSVVCTDADDNEIATTSIDFGVEVDVTNGDEITCTFTNIQLPTIKITKLLTDGSADAEFCFDVTRDGDDSADYQACIDTAVASMDGPTSVPKGDWSIDEDLTGLPLYELESVTCTLDGEDVEEPLFPITLGPSDDLECTYTNIQKASIAVEKICIDTIDVDDTYSFSIDGGDAFDVQCGDTSDPTVVDLGTRTVVEDDTTIPPGWALDSVVCTDADDNEIATTSIDFGVEVDVTNGDEITCTFTNIQLPTIEIIKVISEGDDGTGVDFDFAIDAIDNDDNDYSVTITGAGSDGPTSVGVDTYSITEDLSTLPLWELKSVTCTLNGEDVEEPLFPITLGPSDDLVCTYTNALKKQGLSPGFWKQHTFLWDATDDPLKFDVDGFNGDDPTKTTNRPTDTFNTVFGTAITVKGGTTKTPVIIANPTLLQVLDSKGGLDVSKGMFEALGRQCVAAKMNAEHPLINYAISRADVISACGSAINTGTTGAGLPAVIASISAADLKNYLEAQNNIGTGIDSHGRPTA